MPTPPSPSNIRAFVQWREPSVYAGEEIECIITFKNVAVPPGQEQEEEDEPQTPRSNGFGRAPSGARSRRSSLVPTRPGTGSRAPSVTGVRQVSNGRGHRPTLSLNVVSAPSRGGLHSGGLHSAPLQSKTPMSARPAKGHGRALSIMSLGSEAPSEGRVPSTTSASKKPARGHGRSASLQVAPKPPPLPMPSPGLNMAPRQPSPLYESSTPPALAEGQGEPLPIRPARRRPGTVSAGHTPQLSMQSGSRRSPNPGAAPDFQFPPRPQPQAPAGRLSPPREPPKPMRTPSTMHSGQHRGASPRPPDGWSNGSNALNPISRVMSESSAGTPRSSSEFYSTSNHSDETMTSELPSQQQALGRLLPKAPHSRQMSRSRNTSYNRPAEPETLMMAHVQTMGNFTLDGSLVNAAPFEEIKRKGVQGGGGVVGVERSKRSSGMFGAFSWGNIGESIGGLLGGEETSSIAQMKAIASSKTVPLLSTPQSLLFVDQTLEPGESASYHYRFSLPRGLPPSHRGRAIKVSYHLSIGVQRPGGQAVKHIEIPFRVLGSVNSRGEILGHDLMSPYIILHDSARTKSIAAPLSPPGALPPFPAKETSKKAKLAKQGLEDFLRYTERLLTTPTDANGALLSPTSPMTPMTPSLSRTQSGASDDPEPRPTNTKEVIDFAILRSNQQISDSETAQSTNRFNISRSGQPVAVITLLRPAYRLGEAVIGNIDFTTPAAMSVQQASTYSVLLELESAERVDPSLALRSSNSIHRVTRKIHASGRESSLFARSISFNLGIPAHATPTFETTGVNMVWMLRVEFTTERQAPFGAQQMQADKTAGDGTGHELLEEIGRDDRGVSLLAKERLNAETFEVAVPIRVYGAQGTEGLGGEPDSLEV